ncbi:conserved Plasmodium protein, unknown function [Plasmodium knowlesi strain H]|uniref:RING-type domain-containing protein n=3 Tax=Plasmodium knowlesi TaxID=5850 RepID=A0A5K1UNB8_PLAKH|nr:conserved Plasmodium protein, unknown function [Plasmodium knowlesi strain H]OTN66196.1 Uncharacterized protein PKNOH_S09542500 [Plasmodium knowlesi]CAA9989888.1 conserved Plasmodium protein, unknown function [Plasmodium knowlesi strain H]SBO24449.1 conserved Plasmodium protein, unknown function [Plasmodium knowlesi strain H]SBO26550.1 conserved Plasmodium protein, unknown function [Plasmodium knowlesi strain H]VVS79362.1 conserved Plasmodium protein, unknown function [Plasmodium knowlesi s|eukprot:XP_002259904.1 hypothetical protein, conserved in Plasmodium species [Plasmodium knowlesi strain H]
MVPPNEAQMKNKDNLHRKCKDRAEANLEEFKKQAYSMIEYKDKIIKMLCAILEVQGITTLDLKKFISGPNYPKEKPRCESGEHEIKSHKRRTSSRKRRLIKIPHLRSAKKKKELNLFSSPNNVNEEGEYEDKCSDSSLSSDRESLNETQSDNPTVENMTMRDLSGIKTDIHEDIIPSYSEKEYSAKNSTGAQESFRKNNANLESTCKSNFQKDAQGSRSKMAAKMNDTIGGECPLCLMPKTESLHGNLPPTIYKLSCEHVFHLMCIYETVIRRECRKTCCICHSEIGEEDKNEIITKAKREKKENEKKNKLMLKVMKLQAGNQEQAEK